MTLNFNSGYFFRAKCQWLYFSHATSVCHARVISQSRQKAADQAILISPMMASARLKKQTSYDRLRHSGSAPYNRYATVDC